jgi:hypothetical protein
VASAAKRAQKRKSFSSKPSRMASEGARVAPYAARSYAIDRREGWLTSERLFQRYPVTGRSFNGCLWA